MIYRSNTVDLSDTVDCVATGVATRGLQAAILAGIPAMIVATVTTVSPNTSPIAHAATTALFNTATGFSAAALGSALVATAVGAVAEKLEPRGCMDAWTEEKLYKAGAELVLCFSLICGGVNAWAKHEPVGKGTQTQRSVPTPELAASNAAPQ